MYIGTLEVENMDAQTDVDILLARARLQIYIEQIQELKRYNVPYILTLPVALQIPEIRAISSNA